MLWGIDFGGTKIEGIAIASKERPEEISRIRVPTEAHLGYEHVLGRISECLDRVAAETGERPKRLGLAHPGSVDPKTGLLRNSNTVLLNGKPFVRDLQARLGIEVVAANDANCFALAEALLGAGRGAQTVFGVIMGTGVGGGIVIDGKVLNGAQGIGGEWGHNILREDGPQCYCGKRGCVETFLSGPALERFYESLSKRRRSLAEIFADREDPFAVRTIDPLVENFARALGAVINIVDPHVVVLGGGVSNVDALYGRGAERMREFIFHEAPETKLVKNTLGDSAGVIGAALLSAV